MSQVDNILVGGEDWVRLGNTSPLSGFLGDYKEECYHMHTNKNVHLERVFITAVLISDGRPAGH